LNQALVLDFSIPKEVMRDACVVGLMPSNSGACLAGWSKFSRNDRREEAILRVSVEISQISDAAQPRCSILSIGIRAIEHELLREAC
jgi:hypothetical protein